MVAALCADIWRARWALRGEGGALGFTTRAWKGGRAKKIGSRRARRCRGGSPIAPCDLQSADAPRRSARRNLGLMMREGLLKENIDGEALMWAYDRLLGWPEQRRILMVISDGAPWMIQRFRPSGQLSQRHLRAVIH